MTNRTLQSMWSLLPAALLAITACTGPSDSPRAAAEAFLDAHYVRIDLEAARPFCAGLALDKLEREIALTENNPEALAVERPHVTYRLEEARDVGDRASYAYELAVHPTGTDAFQKLVVMSLRNEGSGWRVSNYSESDR
jgi:hypothetical protein